MARDEHHAGNWCHLEFVTAPPSAPRLQTGVPRTFPSFHPSRLIQMTTHASLSLLGSPVPPTLSSFSLTDSYYTKNGEDEIHQDVNVGKSMKH